MCADSLTTISVSPLNESDERIKSSIDPSYAANAFRSFYGFFHEGKFTDFELSSCDHGK